GAPSAAQFRRRSEAAFRPVGTGLHDMTAALQTIDAGLWHAVLDHEHARPRGAGPERNREMLGMPGRRVDGFLQIELGMNVPQKELRGPLILLMAAGRAPSQLRLARRPGQGRNES